MDRRSRSNDSNYRNRRNFRSSRRSVSRSRSRSRSRNHHHRYRSRSRTWSRSRSRSRGRRNRTYDRDGYKESSRSSRYHHSSRTSDNTSSYRSTNPNRGGGRGGEDGSGGGNGGSGSNRSYIDCGKERNHKKHYYASPSRKDERSDSYDSDGGNYYDQNNPNNTIIVRGLAQHITEADISSDLMQYNLVPVSIRLIRKRKTGTSRGFAFVEFSIKEEAMTWMQHKQGLLLLNDMSEPAKMQYSHSKEPNKEMKILCDWYCAKCGVFNFKRREVCFKCYASREESEKGGEGSDEISNILTKKIMLRNLDVLTNEECVLTIMQEKIPTLVEKITKILVCRDPLTQTSRGICYLYFDNLVDSMNTHNSLKALETPLTIEDREVIVTYCMDSENKQIMKCNNLSSSSDSMSNNKYNSVSVNATNIYTLADVPRLAEYSATMYASSQAEKEYYFKYYTNYYINEISKGKFTNLPTMSQLGETSANSGAAVALSAIQRKMSKTKEHHHRHNNSKNSNTTNHDQGVGSFIPDKQYPPPDITSYQYDETSGYYYDPLTKLYYDSNSQYFYNNDTASYLYYDSDKRTYLSVPSAVQLEDGTAAATASNASISAPAIINTSSNSGNFTTDTTKNNNDIYKVGGKHDKVKVAKKIVKDMEKWAKQLNQKKDMNVNALITAPSPKTNPTNSNLSASASSGPSSSNDNNTLRQIVLNSTTGYADVGFSILENKEKSKLLIDVIDQPSDVIRNVTVYNSDSDDNHDDNNHTASSQSIIVEKDYVDFEKLTCLLCQRAFQSNDILSKHLKMSKLHKENLDKYMMSFDASAKLTAQQNLEYRDRAKERRLKYGECDPPPLNRSKERFEKQLETVTSAAQSSIVTQMPISENNVGNRLLQKMGWQEGQGLGKKNQGRTNIVEADGRSNNAGLGTKVSLFGPGDDYKSYIKKMMKSRYEQS